MKFKKIIFLVIIIIILLISFIFLKLNYISPITNIKVISNKPNEVTVSWEDGNPSLNNFENELNDIIYRIYWSNKRGINPKNPETYLGWTTESNDKYLQNDIIEINPTNSTNSTYDDKSDKSNKLLKKSLKNKLKAKLKKKFKKKVESRLANFNTSFNVIGNEWLYIIVSKNGFKSPEYEVQVMKDKTFKLENLDMRILTKSSEFSKLTIEVDVLEQAEIYRIYYILPNEEILTQDFAINGFSRITLKLNMYQDAMVYISFIKTNINDGINDTKVDLIESEKEFLMHMVDKLDNEV